MSRTVKSPRTSPLTTFTPRLGARIAVAGALVLGLTASMGAAPSFAGKRPKKPVPPVSSGAAMPVGNVGAWTQIYTDDFKTNVATGQFPGAVAGKWATYPDWWKDTSKFGTYMPSKVVSVHDGMMDLNLRTEGGVSMVAAPIPKINGAGKSEGQLYGRYSVRFKSDSMPDYKIAWLLWPDSYDWNDGEIDFPEAALDDDIYGFMHHRKNPTSQDWYKTNSSVNVWHTATTEWHPNYVKFILDGVVVGTSTYPSKIPNTPMHWVLQTETAISDSAPSPRIAGHLLIDWVAVYRLQR